MSKHRHSLSNLRPARMEAEPFMELSRKLDRAQAFAACREGFRAWARAGFPGDDPFSVFRDSAASHSTADEQPDSASGRSRRRA